MTGIVTGTGYRITPVLACCRRAGLSALSAHEVEAIFELPMSVVLDPDAPRRQRQHVGGVWREYWVWPHPEHYIWGATAAILVQLAERLREDCVKAFGFSRGLGALSGPAQAQTEIDSINTNFRWLGPDDKIIVERYDDPRVKAVSCYLSRAETGGIKGGLGLRRIPAGSRSPAGRRGRSQCRTRCRNGR